MEFQSYLSQPYQGRKSFLENIIFPIFGEDNFESSYDVELLDSEELRGQAARTGIHSIIRCGTIDIDLTPIEVFDITVSDRLMMDKNRVGVQAVIRRVMDTYSGAFMIIHYDNDVKWDWRFTFCRMKDKGEFTDNKRTAKGAFEKDDLITLIPDAVHCRKYIEAKDIERYRIKQYRYLEWNTDRCPGQLSRPTFKEMYDKPKLMVNRLGRIQVYLDKNEMLLHSDSMFSAILWKDLSNVNNKSISSSVKSSADYRDQKWNASLRHLIFDTLLAS